MEHLSPSKRFVDILDTRGLPTVHVSRPLAPRKNPLPGMKKVLCPTVSDENRALLGQVSLTKTPSVFFGKIAFALSMTNVVLLILLCYVNANEEVFAQMTAKGLSLSMIITLSMMTTPAVMLVGHLDSNGHDEWSIRAMMIYWIVCPALGILSTYME